MDRKHFDLFQNVGGEPIVARNPWGVCCRSSITHLWKIIFPLKIAIDEW